MTGCIKKHKNKVTLISSKNDYHIRYYGGFYYEQPGKREIVFEEGFYGVDNSKIQMEIKPVFDKITQTTNNMFLVEKDDLTGLVDSFGITQLEAKYLIFKLENGPYLYTGMVKDNDNKPERKYGLLSLDYKVMEYCR